MPEYAGQENWLLLLLVCCLLLSSSEAGSRQAIWSIDSRHHDLSSISSATTSRPGPWQRIQPLEQGQQHSNTAQTVAASASSSSGPGRISALDGSRVSQPAHYGINTLHSRQLLQARGSGIGGPAGKDSRSPGPGGRGSGVSRGTSSPPRRVTHRASAGSGSGSGGGSQGSSLGGGGSGRGGLGAGAFGSRHGAGGSRSGSRRSPLDRGTPAISTYQWLIDQVQDSP